MSDATSGLLEDLDPTVRRLVLGQAETIAERLLAQRAKERPRRFRSEIFFPRGTTEFSRLHQFVTHVADLAAALNAALPTLPDGAWLRFSVADPVLFLHWDDCVAIMLHPLELDVSNLMEVPDTVRVFVLNTQAPYEVTETSVLGADRIQAERERDKNPLTALRADWFATRNDAGDRLLATVRAERDRQLETLPPEVLGAIDDLLARVMGHPGYHAPDLLEAAYYLGIFRQVTAGFGPLQAQE